MFTRTLKRAVFHFYDDLGRCLLVNALWFVFSSLGVLVAVPLGAGIELGEDSPMLSIFAFWAFVVTLSLLLTAPPATAGLFYYANQLTRYEYPNLKTFFRGIKKFAFRAWGLALVSLVILNFLIGGILIYVFYMKDSIGMVAQLLAAINIWVIVYFLAIQIYAWTFLVHQDTSVWRSLKRATLLFFMRPFPTLGLFLVLFFVLAINRYLPMMPLIFLQGILAALFGNLGVLIPLEEYPEE